MTNGTALSETCPFCLIVAGDAPAREVLRTSTVVAFFPDHPAVLGHTLIVPRQHVSTIWDIDEAIGYSLADATRRVARAVHEVTATPGMNIIQSNGHAASQTVEHLHIHVVPRSGGDRMPRLWPPDMNWPSASLDALQSVLSRNLPDDFNLKVDDAPQPFGHEG